MEILRNYECYGSKQEAELKTNRIRDYLNENDLRDLRALDLEAGKKAHSMWRDQYVQSPWGERVLLSEMLRED